MLYGSSHTHTERATGARYRGTMTQPIRRKLAMAVERTSNTPIISEVATVQAAHVWRSFERQQIALWCDNYRRYISGVDPHNLDKSLNLTTTSVCTLLTYHKPLVCLIWMLLHKHSLLSLPILSAVLGCFYKGV